MVENPSSVPDVITSPELEEGIRNGRITTFTITEGNLPYYLEAASVKNFKVAVIAKPGQYYITDQVNRVKRRPKTNVQENKTPTITAVKSQFPVEEGSVGISLERPEGVTNDMAFNLARQQIEQRMQQGKQRR